MGAEKGERTTKVLLQVGTLISSAVVRYQQRFRRTKFCLAVSFYLVLLNHYWAAVPGKTSNEFHTCSNTCSLAVSFRHISYDIDRQRIQRVFKDTSRPSILCRTSKKYFA